MMETTILLNTTGESNMSTVIAVLLLVFSASVFAGSYTFTAVSPVLDTAGNVTTDADIAFFTFKCGSSAGNYTMNYPTIGRDPSGVLVKTASVTVDTSLIPVMYCAATATRQYVDTAGNTVVGLESATGQEVNFVPVPPALGSPGAIQVIVIVNP